MPEVKDTLVITPEPIEPNKLAKGALLGLYYQNKSTIEHMQHHIEKLNEDLRKAVDDNLTIQKDTSLYSDRVNKVIKEMERSHKEKMQMVFNTVSNLQTLLTPPNYDFRSEEEKNNAV